MRKEFKRGLCVILLNIISTLALANVDIRKIVPPNLEASHLGEEVICYRPMRHGAPNMSVEQRGNQVIAHNYGHGGSGWTLGPGSANYVNNLVINAPFATDLKKDTPITIIGAGAIGLFTAYDLQQKGFTNITIVAEKFDALTSHNAGGLLAPVSMDNDPAMQKVIDQIGIDAYLFYADIAQQKNPHFKSGAVIVPTYFQDRKNSGLEPYVGKVMQPAKEVILDFGNGTTRQMVAYDDGIFIDTAAMMTNLSDYLKNKKVKFVQKRVNNFSELKDKYVFNCAGLGAQALNNDSKMVSVQGHLIMLKDQQPKDLQYMILIYLDDGKTAAGQKVKRSFYIFPKHLPNTGSNDVGVIGGTFIEGATDATPNTEEFAILLQNAKDFYGVK